MVFCYRTSIFVRIHAFTQLCLVFFNLFVIHFEYTVDDHESEKNRPLALISLEILYFTVIVVSARFIFHSRQITITTKSFETFGTAKPLNDIILGQIDQSFFVRRKCYKHKRTYEFAHSRRFNIKALNVPGNDNVGINDASTPFELDSRGNIVSKMLRLRL